MSRRIAVCGLSCSDCPAYAATQKNDDNERRRVAEIWSKEYHVAIAPEQINCDGCTTEKGRLFYYPTVCEIRACGRDRGLANCGHCADYPCEKISAFFRMAPQAKITLDEIHRNPKR